MPEVKYNQSFRDGFSRLGTLSLGDKRFHTPAVVPFKELEKYLNDQYSSSIQELDDMESDDILRRWLGQPVKSSAPIVLEVLDPQRFGRLWEEDENFLIFNVPPCFDNPKAVLTLFKEFIMKLPEKPVYAPNFDAYSIPLLSYFGVDVFDDMAADVAAEKGIFMFECCNLNVRKKSEIKENPCCCRVCAEYGTDVFEDRKLLGEHNRLIMEKRVALTRELIRRGELRNFVESEVKKSPFYTSLLRLFDSCWNENQPYPRFRKSKAIFCSHESFTRPEVSYFLRRSTEIYSPRTKVAIVLPCSARKPYLLSKSHRTLRAKLSFNGVNEIIVSSPLVTPRELELCYPVINYDVTVTGQWSIDEVEFVAESLSKLIYGFEKVAAYVSGGYRRTFERACEIAGIDGIVLENVDELGKFLNENREEKFDLYLEIFRHMFAYQFGKIPDLLDGCEEKEEESAKKGVKEKLNIGVRGKYPELFLRRDKERVARIDWRRGCLDVYDIDFVLSTSYKVVIDEFKPRGTIFAAGVLEAWHGIKPGDIVAFENESWKGIGVARMSGEEMERLGKGYAIDVKRVKEK